MCICSNRKCVFFLFCFLDDRNCWWFYVLGLEKCVKQKNKNKKERLPTGKWVCSTFAFFFHTIGRRRMTNHRVNWKLWANFVDPVHRWFCFFSLVHTFLLQVSVNKTKIKFLSHRKPQTASVRLARLNSVNLYCKQLFAACIKRNFAKAYFSVKYLFPTPFCGLFFSSC